MPLSPTALENRREYDRRYRADHRAESRETLRRWQQTPLGRLRNQRYNAVWRYNRRPSPALWDTIGRLTAEIMELGGKS